jgi:zinc transport system permease protein
MTALSALVFLVITIFYKRFFLISFDEDLALSAGIKTKYYNYLLVVLAAITISLAIRIVGVLLIGALMVVPVITAMQLNKSFFKTILIATVFSVSSVLIGLFTSYYANFSSGGTIVLVTISFFLLVLITKKFGQLVRR